MPRLRTTVLTAAVALAACDPAGRPGVDAIDARHNGLLVSICNIMGLPEVTTFGELDDGSGPLAGLV